MSNQDGLRIPDFSVANKLAITNTFFRKNKSRLITFSSGGNHAYIDFILVARAQLKNIKDTKVPRSEECITQVTCLWFCCTSKTCRQIHPYSTKKETWKVKDPAVQKEFEQAALMKCQQIPAEVESAWEYIKNGLLEAADETFE